MACVNTDQIQKRSPRTGSCAGFARRLILAFLLLITCISNAPGASSKETQLKAAFLYNFTKFVEWETEAFSGSDSPLVIGVFGSSEMTREIQKAVQGRRMKGRRIQVTPVSSPAQASQVHILFVSEDADSSLGNLSGVLGSHHVLTVGESSSFERAGGMITFHIERSKVRFDINMAAAQNASLRISSQLLKLARTVRK